MGFRFESVTVTWEESLRSHVLPKDQSALNPARVVGRPDHLPLREQNYGGRGLAGDSIPSMSSFRHVIGMGLNRKFWGVVTAPSVT
jgi:hypothetical protein